MKAQPLQKPVLQLTIASDIRSARQSVMRSLQYFPQDHQRTLFRVCQDLDKLSREVSDVVEKTVASLTSFS